MKRKKWSRSNWKKIHLKKKLTRRETCATSHFDWDLVIFRIFRIFSKSRNFDMRLLNCKSKQSWRYHIEIYSMKKYLNVLTVLIVFKRERVNLNRQQTRDFFHSIWYLVSNMIESIQSSFHFNNFWIIDVDYSSSHISFNSVNSSEIDWLL